MQGRGCQGSQRLLRTAIVVFTTGAMMILIVIVMVRLPALLSINSVNGPFGKRHEVYLAVWTGVDVGDDAEVNAKQQAFTLSDVELGQIVGDTILQPWVLERERPTAAIPTSVIIVTFSSTIFFVVIVIPLSIIVIVRAVFFPTSFRALQIEAEQSSSLEEIPSRADDHVAIILFPKSG